MHNESDVNADCEDVSVDNQVEPIQNGNTHVEASSEQQRISYLEQSLRFLHMQHQQLVSSLHDEIDALKRKNRELQFCIVMMQQTVKSDNEKVKNNLDSERSSVSTVILERVHVPKDDQQLLGSRLVNSEVRERRVSRVRMDKPPEKKLDEFKLQFMDEELKHVKKQLDDCRVLVQSLTERLRNAEHQLAIERTKAMSDAPDRLKTASAVGRQPNDNSTGTSSSSSTTGLPFNATVEPLLVHFPPHPPRVPSLQECQAIVKHLFMVNNQQAHELYQLKIDLRDVLYSHKWTPDAFLLARAYIADDNEPDTPLSLPRIPLKHATKKLPDAAYHVKDSSSFPPMRPVVGNQAIERAKKTQILHKLKAVKP